MLNQISKRTIFLKKLNEEMFVNKVKSLIKITKTKSHSTHVLNEPNFLLKELTNYAEVVADSALNH